LLKLPRRKEVAEALLIELLQLAVKRVFSC
jgi:hypothetical protein